ncbi:MAG: hypothetical protein B6D71_00370 [gamma proteobacterium symbiont of Stewartia floridana]|nr:MAG: hypothetical protein B6D71_00370 [gamma proteobacterium symbiont of Stewartia floridana]
MINPALNYAGYVKNPGPSGGSQSIVSPPKDPKKAAELYQNFLIKVKIHRLNRARSMRKTLLGL